MDQEKIGKFIKDIRKKNNLTQKQLADKYNVTYQAVSKWENGRNMPDTALLRKMSVDFGVSLEEFFDGEYKDKKKKNIAMFLLGGILVLIIIFMLFFKIYDGNDFIFKTLSASCDDFTISGTIAYNDNKSSIYITNISYCGGDDLEEYKMIECVLYESHDDIDRKISSYTYDGLDSIKLEDFLQEITLAVDDYEKSCKDYTDNSLYLSIFATRQDGKVITYRVPLKLDSGCSVS